MKNPWAIIGVITVLLISGSFWYSNSVAEQSNEGINLEAHIKGSENAVVALTEYSDFQCPACAAFQPTLESVLAEYGDSIRFEYKHFPLPAHTFALASARAAEAAGLQGAFFEYQNLLFANQDTWTKSPNPTPIFAQYAQDLGLDVEQFKKQSGASIIRDKINKEAAEGRSLGVTGTPTFFLNGVKMNIQTYEDFTSQVAAAVNGIQEKKEVKFGI